MKAITIRLEESTIESLDEEAAEHDRSRSEHIREVIRARNEHDELRRWAERLEQENERLRREKRMILDREQETTELVAEVRRDRTLAERKAEAGLLTKVKWALVGMDTDQEE